MKPELSSVFAHDALQHGNLALVMRLEQIPLRWPLLFQTTIINFVQSTNYVFLPNSLQIGLTPKVSNISSVMFILASQ